MVVCDGAVWCGVVWCGVVWCGAVRCGGAEMVASQAELEDASVPLQWRDYCAHLLIPLNACRRETLSAPWRCGHERHAYEQCQFNESDTAAAQRANTSTCTCTSISALTDTQR